MKTYPLGHLAMTRRSKSVVLIHLLHMEAFLISRTGKCGGAEEKYYTDASMGEYGSLEDS